MQELIVKNQQELDAVKVDYNGRIIITFGDAYTRAVVRKKYKYSVVAWGNVQIVDAARKNNVKINGNARVVYNPSTIEEWAETNGITIQDGKIRLYKAVHKVNNQFIADWDRSFEYIPGKTAIADGFNSDPEVDFGEGIHMATLTWAAMYGQAWDDMALLELEAAASEVVVPLYETGKVRAPKALVIREVPLEEAGLMGKIIAKRRKS